MKKVLVLMAVGLLASAALADVTVVPNAYANTVGQGGLNTITRNAGNPRSYQVIYAASELGSIPVGYQIVGLTWRMYTGYAPWPPEIASWNDYEIRIGTPATNPGTMSTSFAANFSGNEVLVHDGPLSIPINYFPGPAGPPNPFPAQSIMFQTPWVYPGGDIIIDIRHPGGNHASATGYLDGVTTTGAGYGVTCRAISATTFTPTTGSYTTAYITRVEFVPEPAGLVLMVLGLLLRRR